MQVPRDAVTEDRRLEKAASSTAEALMRHRWHWTLDESNPAKVTFAEYGRAVGRDRSAIRRDAHGYELIQAGEVTSPDDARTRAGMSGETVAATQAVARARGLSEQQTRKTRPVEVKRVREIARQRAEDHGTTIEEETTRIAESIVKSERADERSKRFKIEHRKQFGLEFVEVEGHLVDAKKALTAALKSALDYEWDAEKRELLEEVLDQVKALLKLIDLQLAGAADVDWDDELARITATG